MTEQADRTPPGHLPPGMFWPLVERLGPDPGGYEARVPLVLGGLGTEDLLRWQRTLVRATDGLRTHPHLSAAELAFGGLGDDGFADFRTSVVLAGRATYERFLADPDTLAEFYRDFDFLVGEGVVAAVWALWRERTGRPMWDVSPGDTSVLALTGPLPGTPVLPDDRVRLRAAFPRLWAALERDTGAGAG